MTEPSSGDPRDWSELKAELGRLLTAVRDLDQRVQRLEEARRQTGATETTQQSRHSVSSAMPRIATTSLAGETHARPWTDARQADGYAIEGPLDAELVAEVVPEPSHGLAGRAAVRASDIVAAVRTANPFAAKPGVPTASLESIIGGRWMTWAGALVLVVAVAFSIHWAWTTLDTPDWLRAAGFHLLGGGMLAGAYVLHRRKLPVVAQGLTGLGIFTLYAAAFSMLHFYQFMQGHETWVFVECLAITLGAIVLAVRANSVAVVLLGALGGYLTPILTSSGSGNYVALFLYLACLNLALTGCALWQGWNFLKPLTLVVTAIMFLAWITGSHFDEPAQRWPLVGLVALHAGIVLTSTTVPPWLWRRKSTSWDLTALSGSSLWFLGMTWLLFHKLESQQLALLSWALAAGHLVLFAITFVRVGNVDRMPRVQLALAAVFFTLALPLQLGNASYLAATWCVEGLMFTAVGLYFRDRQMQVTSLVVLLIAAIRVLTDYFAYPTTIAGTSLDLAFVTIGMVGLLTMATGALYYVIPLGMEQRLEDPLGRRIGSVLLGAGNLLLLLASTCQWHDRLIVLLWTLDVAVIWWLGFQFNRPIVRSYAALLAVVCLGGRLLFHAHRLDSPFVLLANARFGSLALVAGLYFAAGWFYRRLPSKSLSAPGMGEHSLDQLFAVLANLLLVVGLSLEIDSWFDRAQASNYHVFSNMRMARLATYSIVWAVYAAGLVAAGFLMRYKLLRLLGLAAFVPILAKVFFVDLAEIQLFPRVLALAVVGVMLLGVSYLYQRYTARIEA